MIFKQPYKNLLGFTLIEVIVSLGIIAIIIGLGLINFQASNDSSSALSTSRDIVASDLRLASDKALLGERFQGQDPIGWGVQFDGADNKYKIFADLDGDRLYDSNETYKSVELTQGLKVYPSYGGVTSGSVLFNTQTGKIYFNNTQLGITTAANLEINLSNSNNAESSTLEITPEGTVSNPSSTFISPDSVAGLVAWWKADSLSLSNGDPVSTWADSSSNANNATQTIANQKPTYISNGVNYLPVVRFDGTNDSLLITDITTMRHYFVVMKWSGTNNLSSVMGRTAAPIRYYGGTNNGGVNEVIIHQTWSYSQVVGGTAYNNGTLLASTASLYRDYSQFQLYDVTTTLTGLSWNRICGITSGSNNYYVNGDVAEIIVYNTVLSASDRRGVEEYLSYKYNIPLGT